MFNIDSNLLMHCTQQCGQPATFARICEQKYDVVGAHFLLDQLQMLLRLHTQRFAYGVSRHGYLQHMTLGHCTRIDLQQAFRSRCGLHAVATHGIRMRVEVLPHGIRVAHNAVVQQRDVPEAPGLREVYIRRIATTSSALSDLLPANCEQLHSRACRHQKVGTWFAPAHPDSVRAPDATSLALDSDSPSSRPICK